MPAFLRNEAKQSLDGHSPNPFGLSNMIRKNRFRPCDICRSRKTRCHPRDGGSCEYCTLHRKQCTFDQTPATRRRASESNATNTISINEASLEGGTPLSGASSSLATVGTSNTVKQPVGSEAKSLGFSHDRFAELYGLSSDMEPILMVSCLERRNGTLG